MSTPGAPPLPQQQHSNGASIDTSFADQTHSNGAAQQQQYHEHLQQQQQLLYQQQNPNNPSTGLSAIHEGKQKAREIMAAATSGGGATPETPGSQTSATAGTTATMASNGGPLAQTNGGAPRLSRKRSRDGTRLPAAAASSSSSVSNKAPGSDGSSTTAAPEDAPPHDEVLLDRYMQRDMLHAALMNDHAEQSRGLVFSKGCEKEHYSHTVRQQRQKDPGSIFGYGFLGYGNRLTEGKSQIVFSNQRGAPKGRRNRQIYIKRKDNTLQADQHEELIPLRLDFENDKLRVRDTFTWNLHEKLISPEQFADYLIEDLKVPPDALVEVTRHLKQDMREQIDNFYPHIVVEDGPLDPSRPYNEHKDDELRIQIKLNITIGRISLIDQFEWDINNPLNSPEDFARQMASENALSGEFTTAIAHSIREQAQLFTRSLYLTNHCFDGRPVDDPELRDSFLSTPIHSAFRPLQSQKDWTPYMYEMSEAEFERTETSMMREHRAQKRQHNRRGGPALPDLKDRQRTVRSLIVHPVIPGAVEAFETTGIPKTRRGGRSTRRPGARAEGEADSEDLDSDDDSGPDSPAPSMLNSGTARTRGMRGAAHAAHAAMRANLGRSQTPDSPALATPHDTRTSMRRSMLREESAAATGEEESLIIKLKVPKAKFRLWVDGIEKKKRAAQLPLSGYASQPPVNTVATTPSRPPVTTGSAPSVPAGHGTPSMTPRSLPATRNTPQPTNGVSRDSPATRGQSQRQSSVTSTTHYDANGRADTDHWPRADEAQPAAPDWLKEAISTLRSRYPDSNFESVMRPYLVLEATNEIVRAPQLEPGASPPPGHKVQFLPRIRCNDCPGKLYTAQPGKVVEDFEVHLRNRNHREKVGSRVKGAGR